MARRQGRKPLLSGNWKMNHDHFKAIAVSQRLVFRLSPADYDAVEVSVHPPFTDIRSVQVLLDNDEPPLALGAQSCHWEDSGAYTGEVSPAMLSKLGVRYVIAGHSERRRYFDETDEIVRLKVAAIFRSNMTPILCVGETAEERDAGETVTRVVSQLESGLQGLEREQVAGMVVAYEPLWAIGTGRPASPSDAQAAAVAIRSAVSQRFGAAASEGLRIQYGGSVNTETSAALAEMPDVDGALVGGASLDADTFADIVVAFRKQRASRG